MLFDEERSGAIAPLLNIARHVEDRQIENPVFEGYIPSAFLMNSPRRRK